LHSLVFSEAWTEEKERNKARRDQAAEKIESSFVESYRKTTGESIRSIRRVDTVRKGHPPASRTESPVEFKVQRGQIEIDRNHPLLKPLFRRRKYAPLVEKLVVAFERSNHEATAPQRRELFYKLLAEIFSDL
jgi:uncharacterized protein (DUF1697 family)